jgi:hypothetical protein
MHNDEYHDPLEEHKPSDFDDSLDHSNDID